MKYQNRINIATASILILMLLHFLGVFKRLGLELDTITLVLFFSALCIFLLPLLKKFKIFGVFELEKTQNEIKEIKTILYRGKVVRDESNDPYFIDKADAYHLLPDEETAIFLDPNESQIKIKKKELKANYKKGNDFGSVLNENTKIVWVERTHVFIILDGKRFHVPSWDNLYSWKRANKEKFEDISTDDLHTKYPDGR
ncbi:MAG: hypothetical protein ACHQEB_05745 [Chitinophagales bacterium]